MAPTPASTELPLYQFERLDGRAGNRGDTEAAREELAVLWKRLDGDLEQLAALEQHDPQSWLFLLRYATEGPLSIKWYESKRPELEAKQRRYNALVMGVAFVLFTLAFLLPFQPLILFFLQDRLELGGTPSTTGLVDVAALLGVVGTGTTVALRLSARGVRYRRQGAVFHQASAALKEQLYRLETDWRGKPLVEVAQDGTSCLIPELDQVIRQAVSQARAVLSDERDQYFETLIVDVSGMTEDVTAATESLGSQVAFRNDRRHEDGQRRLMLHDQLAEAQLACDTTKAKIAVLEGELAAASDETAPMLRAAILEQRLVLQEHEQRRSHLQDLRRGQPG